MSDVEIYIRKEYEFKLYLYIKAWGNTQINECEAWSTNETQETYKIECTSIKDKIAMRVMSRYIDIYKNEKFYKIFRYFLKN